MRSNFSAVTIFAEDLREERSGTETMIGILPDNVNVPQFPFAFPKMAMYTRIVVDHDFEVEPIKIYIKVNDSEVSLGEIEVALIDKALADSKEAGSPITGLISRAISVPFAVQQASRILVSARTSKHSVTTGTLRIQLAPAP